MYDLEIGLRVYPGISKNPTLKGSKLETFEKVYGSILESSQSLKTKLTVFSDGCGDEFHEMMRKVTPEKYDLKIVKVDCFSNPESFRLQYDYLSKSKARLVALIEDDYLLDPDALDTVFGFAESKQFKSYYTFFNSSDYYSHELHNYRSTINFFEGNYWRTVASTTLTFICSPVTLRRNRRFFRTFSFGNFDHSLWASQTKLGWRCLFTSVFRKPSVNKLKRLLKFSLTLFFLFPIVFSRRENLWVCMPGKGTHLETQGFSPDHGFE